MNTKIQFKWNMIKVEDKKIKVWYSKGNYTTESGLPENTITIYAREYGSQIPKELNPENNTDSMTDYFDKDKSRIKIDSIYYEQVNEAFLKQEEHHNKIKKK